jgi:hypothetical protein
MVDLPSPMSTRQVTSLINDPEQIDVGSTDGTYTVQASPSQPVIITAIHVVVLRRVPASRATEVEVAPTCFSEGGGTVINMSINLDDRSLSPKITTPDPANPNQAITLHGLETLVTNDSPIILNFEATTNKYYVTWEILIDYTANGELKQALIENGSHPFQTMAPRPDDKGLIVAYNAKQNAWNTNSISLNAINNG